MLASARPQIGTFVLSFVIVGTYWVAYMGLRPHCMPLARSPQLGTVALALFAAIPIWFIGTGPWLEQRFVRLVK